MSSLFVYIRLLVWSVWEVQSERPSVCSFWEWRVGLLTPGLHRWPWPPGLPLLKGKTVCDVCTNRDGQRSSVCMCVCVCMPTHTHTQSRSATLNWLRSDIDLFNREVPLRSKISGFFFSIDDLAKAAAAVQSQHKLHKLNNKTEQERKLWYSS